MGLFLSGVLGVSVWDVWALCIMLFLTMSVFMAIGNLQMLHYFCLVKLRICPLQPLQCWQCWKFHLCRAKAILILWVQDYQLLQGREEQENAQQSLPLSHVWVWCSVPLWLSWKYSSRRYVRVGCNHRDNLLIFFVCMKKSHIHQ